MGGQDVVERGKGSYCGIVVALSVADDGYFGRHDGLSGTCNGLVTVGSVGRESYEDVGSLKIASETREKDLSIESQQAIAKAKRKREFEQGFGIL